MQKPDHLAGLSPYTDLESSASGSPASSRSSNTRIMLSDMREGMRNSVGRRGDDVAVGDSLPQRTQAGDLFSATVGGRHLPPVREILLFHCLICIFFPH